MIKLKKKIKSFIVLFYEIFCRVIYGMKDRAVFVSFSGKSYSDNPRHLSEKLHELDSNIEIVWLFNNPKEKELIVPEYVKCVDIKNKFKLIRILATSKCVVNNCALHKINKSKKQFFIQLWHGDRAFKKVLYDAVFFNPPEPLNETKDGYCDLAVAGSSFGVQQYRTAFRYNGEILNIGTPRNDMLLNYSNDLVNKIKDSLNIPQEKKILLYAPTFRKKYATENTLQPKQDINLDSILNLLELKQNEKWICLLRSHPLVSGIENADSNKNIIEVSKYEDMADLLLISDILITDYSSSAGDFALLNRPVVIYQPDYDVYLKNDRECAFKMEESPYLIAKNQEELERIIKNLNQEDVVKNCKDILEFYGTNETGKSSEVIAKRIIDWMKRS